MDVVQALLDAAGGAQQKRELLLLADGSGASCLYLSVERGDLAMARAHLAAAGEDAPELLMLVRNAGDTCLHASARSGRADVARALLAAAGPRRHELLVLGGRDSAGAPWVAFSVLLVAAALGSRPPTSAPILLQQPGRTLLSAPLACRSYLLCSSARGRNRPLLCLVCVCVYYCRTYYKAVRGGGRRRVDDMCYDRRLEIFRKCSL